jgi:D-psicose/D-tagatose/L-ribulose 3-epimerase
MKLAICNEVWRDQAIETVFEKAKRIGYDGVEVAAFTLADSVDEISADRRRAIARAAVDNGVVIVGLHWLLAAPKGLHLTTPDDAVRTRTIEYLKRLVNFCGDLGGRVMILGSPQQRSIEPPNTFDDAWKRARDGLAACAATCADRGVTLCLEALAPAETNFVNTAEQALKLTGEVGHPNIGIMLDYKAIATMPGGPSATIDKYGRYAKHFHANEPDGFAPGIKPGATDFAPVLTRLFETGFNGWVSVEPFDYKPDPDTVAATACRTLRVAVPS